MYMSFISERDGGFHEMRIEVHPRYPNKEDFPSANTDQLVSWFLRITHKSTGRKPK